MIYTKKLTTKKEYELFKNLVTRHSDDDEWSFASAM